MENVTWSDEMLKHGILLNQSFATQPWKMGIYMLEKQAAVIY